MDTAGVDELPVVGDDGVFRAMVERRAVQRHLYDRGEENATAAAMAEDAIARAQPGEPIDDAVGRMLAADLTVLPVVSAEGRLEGLLVLDDVKRVPDLVEAVGEGRREELAAAEGRATRVLTVCSLASAALGMVLLALWIEGPAYGLPRWVSWVDALAASLAFIAAVAVSSEEMFSVPLWAAAGLGLLFAAGLGHTWHHGPGSTWLQVALALGFFAMVVVVGDAPAAPRADRARNRSRHDGFVTSSSGQRVPT